ncbi:sugar MFS transporter [Neisseria weaveri]|uniref:Sugar transporter n=1 Tax=Neisseria weaveri TaxID=28091 RepID=A0A448VPN0_9NEIS|nr:sugar MFS transporter [Neisseria weaveri]EGV37007.1 glucose/galactose transporter family protein [Neisseria weaveri ATCC 51223]EGV38138.1 glucose/galactose transporter family protein [Neisseria weaveri LMG 5135]SAY50341.1 sugar transporter [Neisseria weaveri]VEJ51749.1 sugar transporter [Neisseria weaveri]
MSTQSQNNTPALSVLASLFFMMGFITCLNDVLIPHLKEVFHLSNRDSMLVQVAFFSAYAVMSFVVGKVIDRIGYKKTVILGFLITALGAFLFYPATAMLGDGVADKSLYYMVFLPLFFIMATGIVFLQVSGNPYVTLLARPGKESATLTLVQAFNSVATAIAPSVGGLLILTDASQSLTAAQKAQTLQMPYLGLTGILVLLAVAVAMIKLPAAEKIAEHVTEENNDGKTSVFQYKHMILGALAIFFYVGAEVAIGSQYILTMEHMTQNLPVANYVPAEGSGVVMWIYNFFAKYYYYLTSDIHITHLSGAVLLSLYWGGAMVGRFMGSAVLSRFAPNKVLLLNSLVAVALLLLVVFAGDMNNAATAKYALLAIGLFNSIMFPTIFSLATQGLGKFTADASGIICTAIVGGALVPLLQGDIVTRTGDNYLVSYWIPVLCYLYIAFFALKGYKADDKVKI